MISVHGLRMKEGEVRVNLERRGGEALEPRGSNYASVRMLHGSRERL